MSVDKMFLIIGLFVVGLAFLIIVTMPDPADAIAKNKELVNSWTKQRQIESPIIQCFSNQNCDISYRENGKLHLVRLTCNTITCRLLTTEGN